MEIAFKTGTLEKTFNKEKALKRKYGVRAAKAIMMRLALLKNAPSLSLVPVTPPERRHQLIGNRKGQYAVDLNQSLRLIFEPNHDPVPSLADGGIDLERVTAITVIDVIDYH